MILVAHEILPSQAMSLGDLPIAGIVTELGGGDQPRRDPGAQPRHPGGLGRRGDHGRGRERRPDDRRRPRRHGASSGPTRRRPRPIARSSASSSTSRTGWSPTATCPAKSADGTHVELLANINNLADAQAAHKVGATGVGLFRTEYLFLTHHDVPGEEEQYEYYRQIILNSPNQTVTIRTLDLGGDKTVPYLGRRGEPNPFMGWRSTRIFFENPKLFVTQIRAILRAGRHGKVSMLFPMITTLEELLFVNNLVKETRSNLRREGVAFGEDVKTGVMVEVPAAAVCIDAILRETDFISIGSNDLIQYLVAADRDNPKVAHLCEALAPAIFRVLAHGPRRLPAHRHAGDALRRDGRPAPLGPRPLRHGAAPLQHEPRLHPDRQGAARLGDHRPGRTLRPPRAPAQHQRGDPLLPDRAAARSLEHARSVRQQRDVPADVATARDPQRPPTCCPASPPAC